MRAKNKQHSPGPWQRLVTAGKEVILSQTQSIATMYPFKEGNHKNTSLIVAAPQMYDLLEESERIMAVAQNKIPMSKEFDSLADSLSIARGKIDRLLETIDGFDKKENKQ